MAESIDNIINDLRSFVGGRGREDNFFLSKIYASSSHILCVDFSRWIEMRLTKNDTFALAVFAVQLKRNNNKDNNNDKGSVEITITLNVSDDGNDVEVGEPKIGFVDGNTHPISLEREVKQNEQRIKHLLQFPFEECFANDVRLAKADLLIAWLLEYSGEQFVKVMTPYHLKLKEAKRYLSDYNQSGEGQLELPVDLPNDTMFAKFQYELGKLPFATRLHIFNVFEQSGFGKNQRKKTLSDMTDYDTRSRGIDVKQSSDFLRQCKLVTSFPDGTGYISPEYINSFSIALNYAKKIAPVFDEWKYEIESQMSDQLGGYSYDDSNPNNDGYIGSEEFEE